MDWEPNPNGLYPAVETYMVHQGVGRFYSVSKDDWERSEKWWLLHLGVVPTPIEPPQEEADAQAHEAELEKAGFAQYLKEQADQEAMGAIRSGDALVAAVLIHGLAPTEEFAVELADHLLHYRSPEDGADA